MSMGKALYKKQRETGIGIPALEQTACNMIFPAVAQEDSGLHRQRAAMAGPSAMNFDSFFFPGGREATVARSLDEDGLQHCFSQT
jgi:hypothetical protein